MLRVQVLLLLGGFAPTALRACPPGFVAARCRRQASGTVDGWASPIVSVHRSSAPARSLRSGFRMALVLLAAAIAVAGEPLVGEAGLAELAAARASVRVVAGEGMRTVQRLDDTEPPSDAKRVRFAVALDGRYDVVITDPDQPEGERHRFVSDGKTTWEISQMEVGEAEQRKKRPAADDLLARTFACLRLDLGQLRRDYAVELVAASAGRELRLVPSDPALAGSIARIVLTLDAAGRPVRLVLDEPTDNRHRLVLSSFQDDPQLDAAWFATPGP